MSDNNEPKKSLDDVGECCFCAGPCNPSSQSCGQCSRSIGAYRLGWSNLPPHLEYLKNRIAPPPLWTDEDSE
jgi:hypothetical protein